MERGEGPEPQAAINDVVVQIHASGFVGTELVWPSTWTDRRNRDRTPSIPGHELAGVVTAVGYGTDRKSTRLNSSHGYISYAVFCLKKKKNQTPDCISNLETLDTCVQLHSLCC